MAKSKPAERRWNNHFTGLIPNNTTNIRIAQPTTMITESDLSPIVQQILDAFPQFDRWFADLNDTQRKGMKAAWVRQLSHLEPSDVSEAVAGILDGRVAMPKNYEFDRLGCELRAWGGVAASRRIEEQNTQRLREQATPTADRSITAISHRFGPAIKCASSWGIAARMGHVTQAENDDAMAIINQYHMVGNVGLMWPAVPDGDRKSIVDFWRVPKGGRSEMTND